MSNHWPIVHNVEEKTDGRWIDRDSRELLLILAGCAAFWFACGMLFMAVMWP